MPRPAASTASGFWEAAQPASLPRDAGVSRSVPRLWARFGGAGELCARGTLVGLYVLLTRNLLSDFLTTGRFTGLLLLVGESLVIVFTLFRRRALTVDRSLVSIVTTTLSVVGPPLMRATDGSGVVPDLVTTAASAVGLSVIIAGKLTIGRSFGIIPANRGVVASGIYKVVRHPIYAGYLVTHTAFIVAHPTLRNIVVLVVADFALVVRALREERVLAADPAYEAYCRRVSWHIIPGLF